MKFIYSLGLLAALIVTSFELLASQGLALRHQFVNNEPIVSYSHSHALLIGVSDYSVDSSWNNLYTVQSDMDDLQEVLESQHGFTTERLVNPTKNDITDAMEAFIANYGSIKEARLVVVINGHSTVIGQEGYLASADSIHPLTSTSEAAKSSISFARIQSWAREIQSKHVLFLMDSCFSGRALGYRGNASFAGLSRQFNQPVKYFITAGDSNERVPAESKFTPALTNILSTSHHEYKTDGLLTGSEMGLFLKEVMASQGLSSQSGAVPGYQNGEIVFSFDTNSIDKKVVIEIDLVNQEPVYEYANRTINIDERNKHCESDRNIHYAVSATPGWEIKPFSISTKLQHRIKSKFNGISDASPTGFVIEGEVANDGTCVRIGNHYLSKDARGKLWGEIDYIEQRQIN